MVSEALDRSASSIATATSPVGVHSPASSLLRGPPALSASSRDWIALCTTLSSSREKL